MLQRVCAQFLNVVIVSLDAVKDLRSGQDTKLFDNPELQKRAFSIVFEEEKRTL